MYKFEIDEENNFEHNWAQNTTSTITAMEVFQHKGRKFVLVGDSEGGITLIDRQGKISRKRFRTGIPKITAIKPHTPMGSVLYAGEHSIGIAKVMEG